MSGFINEEQELTSSGADRNVETSESFSSDRRRKRTATQPAQGGYVPCHSKAADVEPQFPSGSQFRRTSLSSCRAPVTASSSKHTTSILPISSRHHIPAPPGNFDDSRLRVDTTSSSNLHDRSRGVSMLSREEEEEKMMDALFGGENMDGVMEQGGSMFGFEAEQQLQRDGHSQQLQRSPSSSQRMDDGSATASFSHNIGVCMSCYMLFTNEEGAFIAQEDILHLQFQACRFTSRLLHTHS